MIRTVRCMSNEVILDKVSRHCMHNLEEGRTDARGLTFLEKALPQSGYWHCSDPFVVAAALDDEAAALEPLGPEPLTAAAVEALIRLLSSADVCCLLLFWRWWSIVEEPPTAGAADA